MKWLKKRLYRWNLEMLMYGYIDDLNTIQRARDNVKMIGGDTTDLDSQFAFYNHQRKCVQRAIRRVKKL